MERIKSLITIILLGLSAFVTVGCGARDTARSDGFGSLSSAGDGNDFDDSGAIPDIVDDRLAYCNSFTSDKIRLGGVGEVYINQNRQEVDDRIRVRLTTLTDQFDKSSNVKVMFFRMKPKTSTEMEIDSTPLEFKIEHPGTASTYPLEVSSEMTAMSITEVNQVNSSYRVSSGSGESILQKLNLVIYRVPPEWKALKIALYDFASGSAGSKTLLGQANMLIPAFSADPNSYVANHESVLNILHPFYKTRTQTGVNWADKANSNWCW